MQIKVQFRGNADPVLVAGIGSVVPGEWTEITDEQAADFETIHGWPLKEAEGFEVKATPKKKEESE